MAAPKYKSNQVNIVLSQELAEKLDRRIDEGEFPTRTNGIVQMMESYFSDEPKVIVKEIPVPARQTEKEPGITAIEQQIKDLTSFIKSENRYTERVMVFLDVMNITAPYRYDHFKVDFEELLNQAVNGRNNVGAYAFDARVIMNGMYDKTRGFHTVIETAGFRPVLRDSYNTAKQHGIDTEMAVKMVYHAMKDDFDTAVILSGDKDLLPAVEMLQDLLGKRVEMICHRSGAAMEMANRADSVQYLDEMYVLNIIEEPVKGVA